MVDLDPEFNEELHNTLKQQGTTLKQWFIGHAEAYCQSKQPQIIPEEEKPFPASHNKSKLIT